MTLSDVQMESLLAMLAECETFEPPLANGEAQRLVESGIGSSGRRLLVETAGMGPYVDYYGPELRDGECVRMTWEDDDDWSGWSPHIEAML